MSIDFKSKSQQLTADIHANKTKRKSEVNIWDLGRNLKQKVK